MLCQKRWIVQEMVCMKNENILEESKSNYWLVFGVNRCLHLGERLSNFNYGDSLLFGSGKAHGVFKPHNNQFKYVYILKWNIKLKCKYQNKYNLLNNRRKVILEITKTW